MFGVWTSYQWHQFRMSVGLRLPRSGLLLIRLLCAYMTEIRAKERTLWRSVYVMVSLQMQLQLRSRWARVNNDQQRAVGNDMKGDGLTGLRLETALQKYLPWISPESQTVPPKYKSQLNCKTFNDQLYCLIYTSLQWTAMHNIHVSFHSQFDLTILAEPLNKFIINPLSNVVLSFCGATGQLRPMTHYCWGS